MMDYSPPVGHFVANTKVGWEGKSETNIPVRERMASPSGLRLDADSHLAEGVLVAKLLSLPFRFPSTVPRKSLPPSTPKRG